jgi:hypothetical protein
MPHLCTLECPQKKDLAGVASALATASNAFAISVRCDAEEVIETKYRAFSIAKDKFVVALQVYREHFSDDVVRQTHTSENLSPIA